MLPFSSSLPPSTVSLLLTICLILSSPNFSIIALALNTSTLVVLKSLALTPSWNNLSNSAKVLPLVSGNSNHDQTKAIKINPAQKNPDLAFQFQAVGFSI
ncbi:hypothetical protein WICPIJ_002056 [Wickerhamomyces pijperi]|uniref:Uncharacterized protein n=1 Tax=Wickerhamomyces pijperi TaxID=599730 RepID=A0A9P8TPA8_WICPI|nr:hypothetical protein WICPIJ_002056 [Wickerhamomyces pijperi]